MREKSLSLAYELLVYCQCDFWASGMTTYYILNAVSVKSYEVGVYQLHIHFRCDGEKLECL